MIICCIIVLTNYFQYIVPVVIFDVVIFDVVIFDLVIIVLSVQFAYHLISVSSCN